MCEARVNASREVHNYEMPRKDSNSAPAVLDLIGNTPLVQVTRLDTGPCTLFLKLESQNPGGSIKDRIGLSMIEAAERDGGLQAGRHHRRGHRRQHRPGPGPGRPRQRLPRGAGRARQDVHRESAAPEGDSAPKCTSPAPTSARAIPSTTRTSARGWPRRSPAPFSPTSSTTRPTRWRHETDTGPEIWEQTRARSRRHRGRRRFGRHADRPDPLLPQRRARRSNSCWPIPSARSWPTTSSTGNARRRRLVGGRRHRRRLHSADRRPVSGVQARLFDHRRRKLRHRARAAARRRHSRAARRPARCWRRRCATAASKPTPKRVVSFVCDTGTRYLSKVYNDSG